MERLQKIIAESGLCSRRKAEELILAGRVRVDGEIVNTLGQKFKGDVKIEVDGKLLKKEEKVVYLLNKPKNVLSSVSDDRSRPCVSDLVDVAYRLDPSGRIDFESSGLLILSNDGDLCQKMIHPKYKIPKVYEVTIKGLIKDDDLKLLRNGIILDGVKTQKAKVEVMTKNLNKQTTKLKMTIYEGRNRQIRRMMEYCGYEVVRLHRIKEANIELKDLRPGEYRRLKIHEVKELRRYLDEH